MKKIIYNNQDATTTTTTTTVNANRKLNTIYNNKNLAILLQTPLNNGLNKYTNLNLDQIKSNQISQFFLSIFSIFILLPGNSIFFLYTNLSITGFYFSFHFHFTTTLHLTMYSLGLRAD